jgi:HK97 family phage major capsid protein
MTLNEINERMKALLEQARALPDDASESEIKSITEQLEQLQSKKEYLIKLDAHEARLAQYTSTQSQPVQPRTQTSTPAVQHTHAQSTGMVTLADVARAIVQSEAFAEALRLRNNKPFILQGVTIPTPTYSYDRVVSALQPTSSIAGTLVQVGARNLAVTTYARETTTSYAGAAAPRSKGAAKPETNITYTQVTSVAESIAHLIKVNEEDLADVQGLQQTLQQRGLAMLLAAEENQVLNGDGTSPNLTGILSTSGVVTAAQGADTLADAIVKLIAQVEAQGATVSAVAMNPATWSALVTAKDTTGQYLGLLDLASGVSGTIAGYPIVRTPYLGAGTGGKIVVGDNRYATLWRVGGIGVAVGYDGDDFSRNRVTIRIETRSALDVYRPQAYGVLTLA